MQSAEVLAYIREALVEALETAKRDAGASLDWAGRAVEIAPGHQGVVLRCELHTHDRFDPDLFKRICRLAAFNRRHFRGQIVANASRGSLLVLRPVEHPDATALVSGFEELLNQTDTWEVLLNQRAEMARS